MGVLQPAAINDRECWTVGWSMWRTLGADAVICPNTRGFGSAFARKHEAILEGERVAGRGVVYSTEDSADCCSVGGKRRAPLKRFAQ